jgi:Family of unknown function (DUF6252)
MLINCTFNKLYLALKIMFMNKITLRALFAVLFMAIGFVSCDTEPVDPLLVGETPTETGPASFEVDFSGETYQTETAAAVISNGVITLTATRTDGASFVIMVQGTTVGTYPTAYISYQPSLTSNGIYSNISANGITGSVHITSINATTHKITGTFSFTGYWTDTAANLPAIQFTDGVFSNIAYTGDDVVEPTDAVFEADFDGNTFTANEKSATVGVGLIGVYGQTTGNGDLITIAVFGNEEGTYTGDLVYAEFYHEDGENYYGFSNDGEGGSATVTISEIDTVNHTISGTFSFTGIGSGEGTGAAVEGVAKDFTNGVFTNVPYETEDVNGDACQATVNGTAVNYKNSIFYSGIFDSTVFFNPVGIDNQYQISIDTAAGTGTFNLEDSTTHSITYKDAPGVVGGTEYEVQEGTITVTSTANFRVQGTYSFVVKDAGGNVISTITNGSFDIGYDDI